MAVKGLQEGTARGRKGKRRTRLKWIDFVDMEWRNRGVQRWRTRALDRTRWTSVVRKAKVKLKGL